MEKEKAMGLLKHELENVSQLIELHYSNQEFELWRDKVGNIIKAALDSDDFNRFTNAIGPKTTFSSSTPDEIKQDAYQRILTKYETALISIIQKYEILGLKDNSPIKKEDLKFESPIELFDAMQFHQKVIQASRALFEDGYYAQAIFEAYKAVENFVKKKAGSNLYGKQLMATAFNEEKPIIQVPEAGYFDKDVQEGFKFLFMGASQGIRNPKAHKEIVQNDPYITLEYLGFASFLLKRIDYWEAGTS